MNLQVSDFKSIIEKDVKPYLKECITSFSSGQISKSLAQWETITSDQTILQIVKGEKIEFIADPPTQSVCAGNSIAKEHQSKIHQEIESLLHKKVLVECQHEEGEFLSPIFSVPKKDDKVRLILNLKNLNEYVKYSHFKMDTIHTALDLITQNCWMASLDLKDAYYSVGIHPDCQKYLKFAYKSKLYKYTAYPNGLSSCPRNFTKLMKPVLCVLRTKGHIIIIFIDDLLLIATSFQKCCETVIETIQLLAKLGFVVHLTKSVFIPQQIATFLGFVINSTTMKITLTTDKIVKITNHISKLLDSSSPTIREVAQVIGYIISSLPAVQYGQCHYRAIEHDKITALKNSKGNFDSHICLSNSATQELHWWLLNLPNSFNFVVKPVVDVTMNSDASLSGWGGVMGEVSTGGHWTPDEANHHINYLEILAAYFVLKSFHQDIVNKHVKIMIDNTTAVAIINNMGTCHSDPCNSVACEIWKFCERNGIWLTAAYIPGKQNITADLESRIKNIDTEWMLNPQCLAQALCSIPFSTLIDLFASRINKQFEVYVSYRPDPYAKHIDAFTISWSNEQFYCFPPFSCILKAIRKIIQDKARGILVVPYWPTQTWYPVLLQILEQPPTILQPSAKLLQMPSQPDLCHPLHNKLRLAICLVSGKNYR